MLYLLFQSSHILQIQFIEQQKVNVFNWTEGAVSKDDFLFHTGKCFGLVYFYRTQRTSEEGFVLVPVSAHGEVLGPKYSAYLCPGALAWLLWMRGRWKGIKFGYKRFVRSCIYLAIPAPRVRDFSSAIWIIFASLEYIIVDEGLWSILPLQWRLMLDIHLK